MDNDTLKGINDSLKRFNGKLILENEALKRQIDALKNDSGSSQANFHNISHKLQDLMIKNDTLNDENESLKLKYKKLSKNNEYLREIVRSIEKNKLSHPPGESAPTDLDVSKNSVILKEKLKEITESKYLNPIYDRLSLMLTAFFENREMSSEIFKNGFDISRATFARDTKILKELGYIELMNSKKEGIYILTKSGKKLKKEMKKSQKNLPF